MSTHLKSLARRLSPPQIPIFPLSGTILMPGCELPLNIFEPRYLNMIDDALRGDRLVGIIQPASALISRADTHAANPIAPDLANVGSLGRIKQFSETFDGRYLITLIGLKRFKITGPPLSQAPYRQAEVSYEDFSDDINIFDAACVSQTLTEDSGERTELIAAMKVYAASLQVELNWSALETISLEDLVDQAAMISPFSPDDKQSLLEASRAQTRRRLLIELMTLYSPSTDANFPDNEDQSSRKP